MRGVIFRFLGLDVMNYHEAIWWAIAAIWAALLIASILSLRSQPLSAGSKLIWFLIILALPLVGLAAYAVSCLIIADWSFFKPLLNSRSDAVKSVTATNPVGGGPR